jgi:hypothetical protein
VCPANVMVTMRRVTRFIFGNFDWNSKNVMMKYDDFREIANLYLFASTHLLSGSYSTTLRLYEEICLNLEFYIVISKLTHEFHLEYVGF